MKKQLAVAIAIALAAFGSAQAKGLSKEQIGNYATSLEADIPVLMVCGHTFGDSYRRLADTLHKKMLLLVDLSGYDADTFAKAHDKKIEINYGSTRKSVPERRSCETAYRFAAELEDDMDVDLKNLQAM